MMGMEYTKLGSTGVDVSQLCFGTWRFNKADGNGSVETDRQTAHELLDAFAEAGGNFIDTANSYGGGEAERWIGEWLADRDREDYVIASKVYNANVSRFTRNLSRKNIRAEIEGTLDRLDTEYVDLYYIHRWDDDTPIRETLRTLTQLVEEGKVHYLAASSMAAWQLTKALWTSDVNDLERFEIAQPRYNAADRPTEFLDVCTDQALGVCPYSPLDGGVLTGKYTDGEIPADSRAARRDGDFELTDRQRRVLESIQQGSDAVDATPAQVALRWLIDQRDFTCVPIFGARTSAQLEENLGAIDVSLPTEQHDRITDAYPS